MISIVVAEDHNIVREGLCALLQKYSALEVRGEAADGMEAVRLIKRLQPDIALIDIVMPKLNGIQVLSKLKEFKLKTVQIILSMYAEPELIRESLKNGAKGYLLKNSLSQELILAIRTCLEKKIYLSPSLSQVVAESYIMEDRIKHTSESLTIRECEVLQLIVKGYRNREIAVKLGIAPKTVENHRANIMGKLKVHNTAQLITSAIKYGLVDLYDYGSMV